MEEPIAATHMQNFPGAMLGLVPAGGCRPAANAAEPASVVREWANVVAPWAAARRGARADTAYHEQFAIFEIADVNFLHARASLTRSEMIQFHSHWD
jgi:hypothetical protein